MLSDIANADIASTSRPSKGSPTSGNVVELFPGRERSEVELAEMYARMLLDEREAEIASIRASLEELRAGIRKTLKFYRLPPERRAEIERARQVARNYPDVVYNNRVRRRWEKAQRRAGAYDAVNKAAPSDDAEQEFREAAAKRGLVIGRLIADGAVHRCDVEGKRGKNDGSYLLRLNGGIPWGWFENHKDGEGWETWKPNGGGQRWTEAEKAEHKRQLAAEQARRAKEEIERRDIARKRAAEIVSAATKPPADHPYFIKKQIKPPHGVLYSADPIAIWHWADSRTTAPGVLVVPMRDIDGVLHNVQLIDGEGNKDYLGGGFKTGCFFVVSANGKLDPAGLSRHTKKTECRWMPIGRPSSICHSRMWRE